MGDLRVLFVDDERSLLDGLRRSLHRKVGNWELKFADNGQEALEMMGKQAFDVIVSDMRMPGMNGVQLLTEVKKLFPKTIRFILSGFSDRNMILQSVGLTHQFFAKPCDPDHLIQAIRFSTTLYQHLSSGKVQQIICDIGELPTPPMVYNEMERELNSDDPSIENISPLIMKDSVLSARVLQMVNSAFFGIGRKVSDIAQATMYLGVENLKSLVLILGMQSETFARLSRRFDLDLYTSHSVEVGSIAQEIASELGWGRKEAQIAFTAGLLHDIGKLVMATYFEKEYWNKHAFSMRVPDTEHTEELENESFGINHSQLGAALLALWGIPPIVVNAVAFHHKPQDDIVEGVSLSLIIHIANAIAHQNKPGDGSEPELMNKELIQSLGIEAKVEEWISNSNE